MLKEKWKMLVFYIAFFILCILVNRRLLFWAWVPSGSMEPTIEEGSLLIGTRVGISDISRNDVIIFHYPDDETQMYIKRVIGLPGEEVTIANGHVSVDGKMINDSYAYGSTIGSGAYEVPDGCYFVLGDNRENSYDSRYWKHTYVTTDEIEAVAKATVYPISDFKIH